MLKSTKIYGNLPVAHDLSHLCQPYMSGVKRTIVRDPNTQDDSFIFSIHYLTNLLVII